MTIIFVFFANFVFLIGLVESKLILKQVVILNRHSLRAPLSNNLKNMSPKTWPQWQVKPGYLTTKGSKLAGIMGSYFAAWLKDEGLLPDNCPSEDDIYVFSNTKERTLTSARCFIEKGFPDCNINVHHTGINTVNPLFNPVVHNTSETFKEQAFNEVHEVLDNLHLNEAYDLLSDILDYKESRFCEMDKICSLVKDKNYISITPGLRPRLSGPLKVSNEAVDAFLMQNYEGFPTEDIAWGQLTDSKSWQTIIEINRAYFNATYKTTHIAKDISRPLINCIFEIFFMEDRPKVAIFFGHDVNIHTIFKTLSVKPYVLDNQIEVIPIGSAVVFQRWADDELQKDFFKLSFVYQTMEQLKDCNILSLESPPQIINLELEKCSTDDYGFCPWDNFKSLLCSLY